MKKLILIPLCVLILTGCKSYQNGYDEGLSVGNEQGYSAGYDEGYNVGYSEGEEEGNLIGYDNGFEDGKEESNKLGYDDGVQSCQPRKPTEEECFDIAQREYFRGVENGVDLVNSGNYENNKAIFN